MAVNDKNKQRKKPEIAVEENTQTQTQQYSNIKRMLNTLDKFLLRGIGLIVGICTLAIAGCSVGLLINNSHSSSAVSGGTHAPTNSVNYGLNTWLWSSVAVFALIGIFSMMYVFVRSRSARK